MPTSIVKKYTSGKINCVEWQPKAYHSVDTFITGTWDDEKNCLSLWHLQELDGDPTLTQEIPHNFNINAVKYINENTVAVGVGDGSVYIYQHLPSSHLECRKTWEKCHSVNKVPAPCRALASNGEHLASVGEDGNLVIHDCEQDEPLRILESGGGCSDYAVTFVKAFEVLTGNMQGHLRLWDIRTQSRPSATLLSPDQVSIYDMASHPAQQHLVAAGNEAGSLVFWDMRATSQPLSIISAHDGPISGVQFHPIQSNHLFTSSLDGHVFHWDASPSSKTSFMPTPRSTKDQRSMEDKSLKNAWLSSEVTKGILDTVNLIPTTILPMNCLSILAEVLLVGSDEEAIYIIRNVLV